MSIESHDWHREAFTLTCTDTAWTVKRRAFPPRLDPARDRTNIEEQTHYFSSLILLFEQRKSMQLCAGVHGFFEGQSVQCILLTDALYAQELTFTSAIASVAFMHCSSGKELVAFSAYLYNSKIDRVACRKGMLLKMEINILVMGKAVVLHECAVKQVVLDPLLDSGPLRSLTVFEGKILCHDLVFTVSETDSPKLFLAKTSENPVMQFDPIFLPHRLFKDSIQTYEKYLLPCFNEWMKDNRKHSSCFDFEIDRGAAWGLDLFDPSRTNNPDDDQECPICWARLSSEDIVFGHFAHTGSTRSLIHYYCGSCFPLLERTFLNSRWHVACPICQMPFEPSGLSVESRLIIPMEKIYKLMLNKDINLALKNMGEAD